MKRELVIALGLASVLALAACKKKEEAPVEPAAEAPAATEAAPAATEAAPAAEAPAAPAEAPAAAPAQ